jgi:hypothetical protein
MVSNRLRLSGRAVGVLTLALSDAMKEWRFEPALRSGRPIAVDFKLGFKLSFGR